MVCGIADIGFWYNNCNIGLSVGHYFGIDHRLLVLLILAFDKLDERRMVLIMMMGGKFAFMYAFRRGIRLNAEEFAASKQDSIEEEKEE